MARAVFLIGLCALAFIAGAATTTTFEVFPYRQFRDARLALRALLPALGVGQPTVFMGYDKDYSQPTVIEYGNATENDHLILVGGGPYELMSECPEQGCLAWIIDRQGRVVHAWPLDLDLLWGERAREAGAGPLDRLVPMGLHLFANGDLLVSYQSSSAFPYAIGIAKLDKAGNLLWRQQNLSHHWFSLDEGGRIYVPSQRLAPAPVALGGGVEITCETGFVYDDEIKVLDADGRLLRELPVLKALLAADYPGLLHHAEALGSEQCDPMHLNDVRVLPARLAPDYPGLAAGDLLVSLRTSNALAVLDGTSGRVKWLLAGRTLAQHSPRFSGANKVLAFDNKGGLDPENLSRLVEIDLATNAVRTVYPVPGGSGAGRFATVFAGHIDLHPDGRRALVALADQGRIVEIDLASGTVVWEYVNTHPVPGEERPVRMAAMSAYYVPEAAFAAEAHSKR